MKDYGNAIKVLRKRNSMTQAQLAEQLNVSGQAVSKWENNMAQPDLDTVLKMAELFGISLDEFTRLCSTDAADATPAAEVAATAAVAPAPVPMPAPAPILIGVCTQCSRSIYEGENLGTYTPKLLCKSCVAENGRKRQEEIKRREYEAAFKKKQQLSKLRRSLIIPAIVAAALMVFFIIIDPSDFLGWLLLGIWGYAIAVLIRWDNNWVASIFENTFAWTFAKPGLIIPLSLDGFIWAFCVKIAMAIIWFLISLVVTGLGLILCAILTPFVIPFAIIATKREIQDNTFMS